MAGQNNVEESKYYSGQGLVLISDRDSLGNPTGFEHIGNICELSIAIDVTEFEHKECTSGQRAIDLTITTETDIEVEMVVESLTAENLKDALFGTVTSVAAGSVGSLINRGQVGKGVLTDHLNISSVVVVSAATGTVTFSSIIATDIVTVDGVAYEAVVTPVTANQFALGASDAEAAANLILVVNGDPARSHEAVIGSTTSIVQFNTLNPVADANAMTLVENTTGSTMVVSAATLLGSATGVDGTDYTVNCEGGSINILPLSVIFPPGISSIELAYSHTAHEQVDALTTVKQERWLRFEGLNTARGNKPVIVDIFKFAPNPLAEQELINEEITQLTITGKALADGLRPVNTSKFFRELIDESAV